MNDDFPNSTESMYNQPGAVPGYPQLKPGHRLADRFVIVQFLARGGMGEVYEASDERLQGKHYALKTLRPEIAAHALVRQRFEREVLLAREVIHPNVCPTYDIFRDDSTGTPILFLTMKLIRGESLKDRLSRAGALGPEQSLPIVLQMAAALGAANQAGVIHRDFKPGNVMVEGAGADVQVSITDFGLSQLYDSDSTLADTGRLSGTIGYIAPELLQGKIASPASDVYAFGVVLHEMLTGRKPQNKPGSTEFTRPSSLVEGVPRVWDRVILGCLAHDSAKRFQSAGEAVAALDSVSSASWPIVIDDKFSRRRLIKIGAGAVAVAAAMRFGPRAARNLLHPLPKQQVVAVLEWPPAPDSPEKPLMRLVLDSVANRLARAESVLKDFAVILPGDAHQAAPKILRDVVGSLGANLVLGFSLRPSGSGHAVTLRVMDAETGKILRDQDFSLDKSALSDLAEKASASAADLFDLPPAPASMQDQDELKRLRPSAYRLFSEAEDLRAEPNNAGLDRAIEKYQKVLETELHFALGFASLSLAYREKYYRSKDSALLALADRNAALALQHNPESAKGLLATGLVSLDSGHIDQAIEGMDRALRLDPGNPQILNYKARAFFELGRPKEQEAVYYEILRQRPNFWPAYNDLGAVLYRQTRYQDAADVFGKAAAVAPRVALPLANQGVMYMLLKSDQLAEDAFHRSLLRGQNEIALSNLGTLAFKRGDYAKALEHYRQALEVNQRSFGTWRNVADCYAMLGDRRREADAFRKASALLSDALQINPRSGENWATLSFFHAKLGLRALAEADLKNAQERGLNQRAQFTKAQTLAVLGRKEESIDLVIECMDRGLSLPDVDLALDLKEVRADPRFQRYIAAKNKAH